MSDFKTGDIVRASNMINVENQILNGKLFRVVDFDPNINLIVEPFGEPSLIDNRIWPVSLRFSRFEKLSR